MSGAAQSCRKRSILCTDDIRARGYAMHNFMMPSSHPFPLSIIIAGIANPMAGRRGFPVGGAFLKEELAK